LPAIPPMLPPPSSSPESLLLSPPADNLMLIPIILSCIASAALMAGCATWAWRKRRVSSLRVRPAQLPGSGHSCVLEAPRVHAQDKQSDESEAQYGSGRDSQSSMHEARCVSRTVQQSECLTESKLGVQTADELAPNVDAKLSDTALVMPRAPSGNVREEPLIGASEGGGNLRLQEQGGANIAFPALTVSYRQAPSRQPPSRQAPILQQERWRNTMHN